MSSQTVPRIFSIGRRKLRLQRAKALAMRGRTTRWLADDLERDAIERIDFMQLKPDRALIIGQSCRDLSNKLAANGCEVTAKFAMDEEQPLAKAPFDFIASFNRLDTVNDLPGALIHMRNALASGGLMIANMPGAGSLPALRNIMLAADGDRPAARIHPQIDNQSASGLLQRAGYRRQVVDGHKLTVRYPSLKRLVDDLREQALTSVLLTPSPALGKASLQRAKEAFDDLREDDGKVTETFEILTLTGWA